ncbi:hypothetical protein [Lysobacter capsici]|uniref:hypothetical protein n=1 Tax=Lysobacter capsici TaxID=435897 RepID=UPI001BFFE81D|nr:hypothetical protein [Lysobacter capsici]QWF16310.1 hypothetical protein KME82_21545 [Lysobacter capsici]
MSHEALLLTYLREQWPLLDQLRLGVWVALHEPLTEDDDQAITPVRKAWLLDHRQAHPCSAVSYKIFSEAQTNPGAGGRFERGSARLAPYPTEGHYYLDYQAGPLFGEAWRVRIDEGHVVRVRGLWKS